MTKPETNLPDTNVIIRYLTRDVEALYARAKAFFDKVKDGRAKAIILESVIAESIYVLTKMYAVPRDLAALSLTYPVHVRFIEQMPIGAAAIRPMRPLLTPELNSLIAPLGRLEPVSACANDGPAERYRIAGAPGEIGFISAISHHFCDRCNRLRLTASGGLRPCLLSDHEEDLRTALRSGADDEALAEVFLSAVRHKPAHHHLAEPRPEKVESAMSGIGG